MQLKRITATSELIIQRFHPEEFVGRRWLVRAAAAFRDDPQARRLVIVGPPGSGKSAFIAYLAHRWNCPRHFVRTGSVGGVTGVDARAFLVSVGAQLFEKYGEGAFPPTSSIEVNVTAGVAEKRSEVIGLFVDTLVTLPFLAAPKRSVDVHVDTAREQSRVIGERVGTLVDIAQVLDPLALLHLTLLQPLRAIERVLPGERVVLLVDALDEGLRQGNRQLLDLLPRPADPDFPPNLRLLLTSRPGRHLDEAGISPAETLPLGPALADDASRKRSQRDACYYLLHRLRQPDLARAVADRAEGGRAEYASALARASDGNFLYLDYLFRSLGAALERGEPLPSPDAFPHGLDEIYRTFAVANIRRNVLGTIRFVSSRPLEPATVDEWRDLDGVDGIDVDERSVTLHVQDSGKVLGKLMPRALSAGIELVDLEVAGTDLNTWAETYLPVLGVLAVARAPLSPARVAAFAGVDAAYVASVLSQLAPFLARERGPNADRYRLYHTSFAEYLLDGRRNRDFPLEAAAWHSRIAAWYRQGQAGWNNVDWSRINHDYPYSHLAAHLRAAGEAGSLCQLIGRPWLDAHLRQTGGYRHFVRDAGLALEAATGDDAPDLAEVARLALAHASALDLASAAAPEALGVLAALGDGDRAYGFAALTAASEARARAYAAIGEALLRQGDLATARAALRQARQAAETIEEEPEQHQRPDLLQRVALALVQARAFADAEATLALIERSPYRATATQDIVLALAEIGEAERALRLALAVDDADVRRATLSPLARGLARQGKVDAALQAVDAMEHPAAQAEGLGKIAAALSAAGAAEEMRSVGQRGLDLGGPNAAVALAALAAPLVAVQEEAWLLEKARALDAQLPPTSPERAHLARALAIAGAGEAAQAQVAAMRASLEPGTGEEAERGRAAFAMLARNELDAAVEAGHACQDPWVRALVLAGASLGAGIAGDAVRALALAREATRAAHAVETSSGRSLALTGVGEAAQLAYRGPAADQEAVQKWFSRARSAVELSPAAIRAVDTAALALAELGDLDAAIALLRTAPLAWTRKNALGTVLVTAAHQAEPVESLLAIIAGIDDPQERLAQLALLTRLWPKLDRAEPTTVFKAELRAAAAAVDAVPPLALNDLAIALAMTVSATEVVDVIRRLAPKSHRSMALEAAAEQLAAAGDVDAVVSVCAAVERYRRADVVRKAVEKLAESLEGEEALAAGRALRTAGKEPPARRMRVGLLSGAAQLMLQGGEASEARRLVDAVLLRTEPGTAEKGAQALLAIAETLFAAGLEEQAFHIAENTLPLVKRIADETEAARTLGRGIMTFARLRDGGTVRHVVKRFLAEPERLPPPEGRVELLTRLSEAMSKIYSHDQVPEMLQLATEAARQIENGAKRTMALARVAVEWKRHRQDEEASALLEEASTLARNLPKRVDRSINLAWLVDAFLQAWDEEGAIQAAREAAELARTVPGERDAAFSAQVAAGVLARVEQYEEALALARTIGRSSYRTEALFSIARWAIQNRRWLAEAALSNATSDLLLGRGATGSSSRAEKAATALARSAALKAQAEHAEADLETIAKEGKHGDADRQQARIERLVADLQKPPPALPPEGLAQDATLPSGSAGEPGTDHGRARALATMLGRAAGGGRQNFFETLSQLRWQIASVDDGETLQAVASAILSVETWWDEEEIR